MKSKRLLGYEYAVLALTALVALVALYRGERLDPSPYHRIFVVILLGVILLLLRPALTSMWKGIARMSSHQEPSDHVREPAAY